MKIVFNDPAFSFQLLRVIGSSYYGGADIGECLSTAYRIKEGDFESWYNEWNTTAKRVEKYADDCLSLHHTLSAQQAYLRASNYYRTAEFFLHENPDDNRIIKTWENSVNAFTNAARLFPFYFESVEIPYEETILPGYFYSTGTPSTQSSKDIERNDTVNHDSDISCNISKPTLIVHTGFDGTQEELYSQCIVAALQRGYNCLTFEGPGQGRVIRKQQIPFRYDWEKVVTPVVDFVLNNENYLKHPIAVDPKRIALMGISLGGYLAARASAYEKRIAACILDDGVFSVYDSFVWGYRNSPLERIFGGTNTDLINTAIQVVMGFNISARWAYAHGMWVFDADTPFDLLQKSKKFTLENVIDKIECPTLVMDAQYDNSFPGQPKKVYDKLACKEKRYELFTEQEGAEDHCHVGALSLANQRIFDWLDNIIKK